jgi:hypothetical protein
MTAMLGIYSKRWPANIKQAHGLISAEMELHLQPCQCGGRFIRGSSPKCPQCKQLLSADKATGYIEAQSAGTAKGWHWQRNWQGLYCVIINERRVQDNFKID